MNFSILPPHLHAIANSANKIIKTRYGLSNGIVEQEITPDIPLRPTLHWNWKAKTQFIACEVSERPFPAAIKAQWADIKSTNKPVRFIVAYSKATTLSLGDYQKDLKELKKFGIGYVGVDENGSGEIEYQGISLALHISDTSSKDFVRILKPSINEAFEHYMTKGDPDVALQKIGQDCESIIYNVATEAKKKGNFTYSRFNPPNYIRHGLLIDKMIEEKVIDVSILGRCKHFVIHRNSVSHKPKSWREAAKIQSNLKDNFKTGLNILKDLPAIIRSAGYRLKL